MSEILPCPMCGDRNIEYIDICTKQPVEWKCCNASFRTRGGWNRYAAAMELAKAKNACSRYFLRDEKQIELKRAVYDAEQRVLEVFNG